MPNRDPRNDPRPGDVADCHGLAAFRRIVIYVDLCPPVLGGAWIGFKRTKRSQTWATPLGCWRKDMVDAKVITQAVEGLS